MVAPKWKVADARREVIVRAFSNRFGQLLGRALGDLYLTSGRQGVIDAIRSHGDLFVQLARSARNVIRQRRTRPEDPESELALLRTAQRECRRRMINSRVAGTILIAPHDPDDLLVVTQEGRTLVVEVEMYVLTKLVAAARSKNQR